MSSLPLFVRPAIGLGFDCIVQDSIYLAKKKYVVNANIFIMVIHLDLQGDTHRAGGGFRLDQSVTYYSALYTEFCS